jgi:hypothetical protein
MHSLILALPLMWLAADAGAPADPAKQRYPDRFFVTLEAFQPLEQSLPFCGLRLSGRFGRFGLEASLSSLVFPVLKIADVSALAVLRVAGHPFLVRAGVSGFRSYDDEGGGPRTATGFHVGASVFTGKAGDRARVRLDYTYRSVDMLDNGFSSLGLGLVIPLGDRVRASR